MKYFVIVYDRRHGKVVVGPEQFSDADRAAALRRRFLLESEMQAQPDYEVVVLGAETEEALHRTHGRYFRSLEELLNDSARGLGAAAI